MHLSKSIEFITPRVKSRLTVNLTVTAKCQCKFIFGKKCTILVSNVDNGEGLTYVGRSLGWEDPLEGGHVNPLQFSCLENPTNRGAWHATVHRVAKNQTRLKRLRTALQNINCISNFIDTTIVVYGVCCMMKTEYFPQIRAVLSSDVIETEKMTLWRETSPKHMIH